MYIKENHIPTAQLIKSDDRNLIDLVEKILVFSPKKRLTIQEVLKHPFFEEHADEDLHYKSGKKLTPDGVFNNILEIREHMYELIYKIHSEHRAKRNVNTYYEKYTNYN